MQVMEFTPKWLRTIRANKLERIKAQISWWEVYTSQKELSERLLHWNKMSAEELDEALKSLRITHLEILVETMKYLNLLHKMNTWEHLIYSWSVQKAEREFEQATKSLENSIEGLDTWIKLRRLFAVKGA